MLRTTDEVVTRLFAAAPGAAELVDAARGRAAGGGGRRRARSCRSRSTAAVEQVRCTRTKSTATRPSCSASLQDSSPSGRISRSRPLYPLGTDNANYRLGDDKLVRLPRQSQGRRPRARARVAARRSAAMRRSRSPSRSGRGEPAEGFPLPWAVYHVAWTARTYRWTRSRRRRPMISSHSVHALRGRTRRLPSRRLATVRLDPGGGRLRSRATRRGGRRRGCAGRSSAVAVRIIPSRRPLERVEIAVREPRLEAPASGSGRARERVDGPGERLDPRDDCSRPSRSTLIATSPRSRCAGQRSVAEARTASRLG